MFGVRRPAMVAMLVAVLALALSTFTALAEEGSGLEPRFGDGKLTIVGNGFKPGEQVTLDVETDADRRQFRSTADAQGHLELATGMLVKPGSGVELSARGDSGTGMAAMTSAPMLPGAGVPATEPSYAGQRSTAAGLSLAVPLAALVTLGLLGVGVALRRSRRHA